MRERGMLPIIDDEETLARYGLSRMPYGMSAEVSPSLIAEAIEREGAYADDEAAPPIVDPRDMASMPAPMPESEYGGRIPPEMLRQAPPSAAPPGSPQAVAGPPGREMPPPIDMPERRDMRTGSKAGRIMHGIAGGLLQGLSGGRSDAGFRGRMDREQARSEQDYQDQLKGYDLQVAERKRAEGAGPISDDEADTIGVPRGTTIDQLQRMQGMGVGSRIRQREGNEFAQDRDSQRNDYRLEQDRERSKLRKGEQDNRHGQRMTEIAASKKKKRGGGGTSGPVLLRAAAVTGLDSSDIERGLNDIRAWNVNTSAARAVMNERGNKFMKPLVDQAVAVGKVQASEDKNDKVSLRKHFESNADINQGMKRWREWSSSHTDEQMAESLAALAADPSGSKDPEAKRMLNILRGPVGAFVRSLSGAAMSEQEANLIMGGDAGLFLNGVINVKGVGVDSLVQAVGQYVAKNQTSVQGVRDLVRRIEGAQSARDEAKIQGVSDAALSAAPDSARVPELRKRGKQRLGEALQSGEVERPEGATLRNVQANTDGSVTFEWVLPDGTTQKESL